MWRKKKTESGPSLLNKLINKLLSMILYEVLLSDGKRGLFSLSLVSRRFYLHVVPHLYRNLVLDFDRASHMRLLKLLCRPESQLPGFIRQLNLRISKSINKVF
jgi:hypothetical protein